MRPELFWEEELEDFEGDPWQIARSVGVRVLSDKDFRAGFQVDGEVVAVLFDASTVDEYSFDIAVLPEYQNKGLGRKLIELALDQYGEQREYRGEEFHLSLDVISPVMEALLKRYGFVEVGRERGHTLMEKRVAAAWLNAKFSPPRQRGGENGRNQRKQKPKDKRKDQRYYRKHRTRILRDSKKHYKRRCKMNSNCMTRKKNYNKDPKRYQRKTPKSARQGSGGGDCYEANGRYFLSNLGNKNLRLVHGEVTGQGGLAGVNYGHAWLEDGNTVIDVSNGRNLRLPKVVYYALGGIDRNDNYHVYDASKFRQRVTKHEHWGPWDLKTSTGL